MTATSTGLPTYAWRVYHQSSTAGFILRRSPFRIQTVPRIQQVPAKPVLQMACTRSVATQALSDVSPATSSMAGQTRTEDLQSQQAHIENMISSLPLIRYLRSPGCVKPPAPIYQESRPYRSMHPSAGSTHLVIGSLLSSSKLPVDPYFFVRTHETHRVIATCYIGAHLCGHPGYVHGGLAFLLFDDVFARCASLVFRSGVGMTANMNIDFRKPSVPDRMFIYRAEIKRTEGRKAWVVGQMRCLNQFTVDEMMQRGLAASDGVSVEEKESELVAEATALFVEPKFGNVSVDIFPLWI